MRRLKIAALVCAAVLSAQAGAQPLLVFAAASLKNALDDQLRQFRSSSGQEAVASYAASSTLARQIENGAPADLFISADTDWMDYLAARGRIVAASRINLLSNRLVLIAPRSSGVKTEISPGFPLAKLLDGGRLALADPERVPAGKYAKAALESLGVWPQVAGRIASAEDVRAALVLVARAEAPLGIVYSSDALIEPKVRVVAEFPPSTHPPIVYPAALVAERRPSARTLLDYLRSPAARELWRKYGFAPLP